MPLSRPDRLEILSTVESFLDRKVKPVLEGELGFEARIAIALLRTLGRELRDGPAYEALESQGLAELLPEVDPAERQAELCRRIRDGRIACDDPRLLSHLRATTLAKIAIDQPKYPSYVDVCATGWPSDRG